MYMYVYIFIYIYIEVDRYYSSMAMMQHLALSVQQSAWLLSSDLNNSMARIGTPDGILATMRL